jgi:hypothetical protein
MEITYEKIRPLVKSEKIEGHQIKVEFQADGMTGPIQTVGMLQPSEKQILKNTGKQAVKRGVVSGIISSVARLFGQSVGGGIGGSVASSATSSVGHAAAESRMGDPAAGMFPKITEENKPQAILAAFNSVAGMFKWDEETQMWKANQ